MTRTRASAAWISRSRANVASLLPSSTRISSYGDPMRVRTADSSSCIGATLDSSSRRGMTIESSGAAASGLTRLLLPRPAFLQQPPDDGDQHDARGKPQGDVAAVRLHQLLRRLPVADRQQAEGEIARAAGQADGDDELEGADLRHAGHQHEQ